jgi:hypothetical protein
MGVLPLSKPRGTIPSMLFLLGLVSKKYVGDRDAWISNAYYRHFTETLGRNQRSYVLKLKKDRENIANGLLERIASLEAENERLKGYK